MKKLIALLFVMPSLAMAAADDCFTQTEAETVIKDFTDKAASKGYLLGLATEEVKDNIADDSFVFDSKKKKTVLAASRDVTFNSGKVDDYINAVSESTFSAEKCVWDISFALPEDVRAQCDKDKAYGYFFEFRKVDGKVRLYNMIDLVSDYPLCPVLNKKK